MNNKYKSILVRTLNVTLIIALIITISYLLTRFLFPFLLIILFSALLQKPIAFIKRVLRVNQISAVLLSITIFIGTMIFSFSIAIIHLVDRFNSVLIELPVYLNTINSAFKIGLDDLVNYTLSNLEELLSRLNFSLSSYLMGVMDNLFQFILSYCQKLLNQLVPFISESIFLTIEITSASFMILILTILLSKDWDLYVNKISKFVPNKLAKKANELRRNFLRIGWGYLKVELIVASVTTLILLIGFYLIEVQSPISLALTFGLIDLIPLIGVGLLLWPWIFYTLLTGNYLLTIQLAVIYIVIVCIRQILEPRLVSKQTGTNSLIVISIGYLGYILFGIYGIIFTPIALISIQTIKVSRIDTMLFNYIRFGKAMD